MPSAKYLHLKFTSLKYMSSAKCVYVTVKGYCNHLNGDRIKLTDLPIQNLLFNLVDMLVFAHAFPLACSHWWPVRCIVWGWGDGLEAWTRRCWTLFPNLGMVSDSIFPVLTKQILSWLKQKHPWPVQKSIHISLNFRFKVQRSLGISIRPPMVRN